MTAAILFSAGLIITTVGVWWLLRRALTAEVEPSWPIWADVPRHCVQCGRTVPFDNVELVPGVLGGPINVRYLPIPIVCRAQPRIAGWACTPDCRAAYAAKHDAIYHPEGAA